MKKTILIVDDDKELIKMLSYLFIAKKFEVEVADSGVTALKLLERVKPDVIFLDLMMPDMDGFQFCEVVKKDNLLKDIPIIVLSAMPADKNRDRVLALGAVDYFEKPFKSMDLVNKSLEIIQKNQDS